MIATSKNRPWWIACLALALVAGSGCSIATGDMLTFFPQKETLLPAAKQARRIAAAQPPLPVPRELNKLAARPYTVEPGDGLLLQPADIDSKVLLPPDQTILPDGTIHLGKYGQINVAGRTVVEIESLARSLIARVHGKDMGAITVRIVAPESKVYYVLGEVNTPGSFQLKGRETVLDGILAAGGLTARASRSSIILARPSPPHGCRVVLPICYEQIVQLGDTTTNYQLQSGDRIFIASRTLTEDVFGCHIKGACKTNPQTPCLAQGGAADCNAPITTWHSEPLPTAMPMPVNQPKKSNPKPAH